MLPQRPYVRYLAGGVYKTHNVECRFNNSGLRESTTQIVALHSLVHSQPIPNFPATVNALSKLGKINASPRYAPSDVNIGAARLRIILTALEIPICA